MYNHVVFLYHLIIITICYSTAFVDFVDIAQPCLATPKINYLRVLTQTRYVQHKVIAPED